MTETIKLEKKLVIWLKKGAPLIMFIGVVTHISPGGGGGVLPQILDKGVLRRFLNPNPV